MDIFALITLIGGLAFFLYGMTSMSSGLEKMVGGKLESSIKMLTSNTVMSLLLGAGITIAIQSSSATTVMLVGLVNSGLMEFSQTIGVIMGANVGTTLTAWILSLAGISSEAVLVKLMKPEYFSLIFAFIGSAMIMTSKKKKVKDIGGILVAFAVLMYGMKLMSQAVEPLTQSESFRNILVAFKNPLLGILVGTVFTGIIQSSAASIGILQAFALTGGITYSMAIPIILGQNIGTCVTALISSIGVSKNAKRVSVVHITIKIIGAAVFLVLYYALDAVFDFAFVENDINAFGIAAVHSIFNIVSTVLLMPFSKLLVKLTEKLVGDKKTKKEEEKEKANNLLDDLLLKTPAVAIAECSAQTVNMCSTANIAVHRALSILSSYSDETAEVIRDKENRLDMYEDKLGTFLVKLSSKDVTEADSKKISRMLHSIGDFERLGDHALNLLGVADEIRTKELSFTESAQSELKVLTDALDEILDITTDAFINNDLAIAAKVEPLEQVIDVIIAEIKSRHIDRLQAGDCSIQMGFVLSDLLTNFERISDHCSNIAVAVIELSHSSFDTHEYLSTVKTLGDEQFRSDFEKYNKKYSLA